MNKDAHTAEDLLKRQLALCASALDDCLKQAEPRPDDEDGIRRDAELANAAMLLKASARLGFALAKLKGEFRQNIRVERQGGGATKSGGSNGQAHR